MVKLTTSIAQEICWDIFDYDDLKWDISFLDKLTGLPEDLNTYAFDFILKNANGNIVTYSIGASVPSTTYLTKDSSHVIIEGMLKDIRKKIGKGSGYYLLVNVTDADGILFPYLKINFVGKNH